MQQIADWLKMLGVSEYTDRFVENRIDLSLLPDLTDQDLEKLGVLLGDRRKMLRAARNLDNVSVAATVPATTVSPSQLGQTMLSAARNGSEAPLPTPRLDVRLSAVRLAFDALLVRARTDAPWPDVHGDRHHAPVCHPRAGRWPRACLRGKQAR